MYLIEGSNIYIIFVKKYGYKCFKTLTISFFTDN